MRATLRWMFTLVAVLIVMAFLFSMRRSVQWVSPSARYGSDMTLGLVYWGWRPEGWSLAEMKYPPKPGWGIAHYGGSPKPNWWFDVNRAKWGEWIGVPLWVLFVASAFPAAVLWYRDRTAIRESRRRILARLTPRCMKRFRLWPYCVFCLLHAVGAVVVMGLFDWIYDFFVEYEPDDRVRPAMTTAIVLTFWLTPLFAIFWTRLYVRFMNRLYFSQPIPLCRSCGYNLTGNDSGRCSECGMAIPDSDDRRRPSVAG